MKLLLFKLAATAAIGAALVYPFVNPDLRSGVLASVERLGWLAVLDLVVIFLVAVALYCRSLQRCLELVRPEARAAAPKSVWLMFLIPYNFVEDFFIIHNVSRSLRAQARTDARLAGFRSFGELSGFGWCTAQIVSLVPSQVGELAGVVAIGLWLVHWRFIAGVNRRLSHAGSEAPLAL
ncbi:hypothetical protein [Calidithermus chliarophilus]|uniref:hypothetical protein n=1 Tax=Calidithermus chliarophilus TaxID=52023 RepID=UPI000428813B|nr:hypothetical protein [Calidithermus chliarophilus]